MSNTSHILVIEDEENILEFIKRVLTGQGYKVYTATSGKEGISMIASLCPELILLDLGLPDIDGMDIISKVRAWTSNPIIVVSARTHENDKVLALDAGADDYITKPFSPPELLARIRTSLRHANRLNTDASLTIRPYKALDLFIDFEKHIVMLKDEIIHLTPVEYKIVTYLAKNSGKVLTYSTIMQNVWGPYIDDDTKILRVNMANIRRKLESNPGDPSYIFTEIGVGYRMLDG
jgi:two-component system, OmpR family, KDP operon response regulator KdpE